MLPEDGKKGGDELDDGPVVIEMEEDEWVSVEDAQPIGRAGDAGVAAESQPGGCAEELDGDPHVAAVPSGFKGRARARRGPGVFGKARPRSSLKVKEVPSVVPMESFSILDLVSGRRFLVKDDSGAQLTACTDVFAREHGLVVVPRDPAEFPPSVGTSSKSGPSMAIVGQVAVELVVPGSDMVVATWMAVVPDLWTPFTLGRNVLGGMGEAMGRTAVVDARQQWLPESVLGEEAERLREGVPVTASADVKIRPSAETRRGAVGAQMLFRVGIDLPQSALRGADGEEVASIEGTFTPGGGRSVEALISSAVVRAVLNHSAKAPPGMVRAEFLVSLATGRVNIGRMWQPISSGSIVGTFTMASSPVVVASVHETGSREALLDRVVEATLAASRLLESDEQRDLAREAIASIPLVEDLERAAQARGDPFEIKLVPRAMVQTRHNYSRSVEDDEFAERQLRQWLQAGVIRPSSSPWVSPIVIAHHPRTGKKRFCVDYRALNALTVPDPYLMPRLEDIQHALRGKKVFSKVDLAQGFNQFPLSDKAAPMTAFNGPRGGHYEFVGSPFGLRNLPAAFQRFMDGVLGAMSWQRACVYVDDIVVFSDTVAEHHEHLAELGRRLRQFGVCARASKCEFYREEVEFVGYVFSGDGVAMSPDKVAAVLDVPVPGSREELRRFLGLSGQFRNAVQDYASIARPLEQMKHKASAVPFDMSEGSLGRQAFEYLRAALVAMPKLYLPDMNKPFIGYQDSSYYATGFVLAQVDEEGVERPVGYWSKAFSPDQRRRWTMPTKEAWGLRYFVAEKLHYYFASKGPHKVFVDAKGSAALGKATLKDPMLHRIALSLAPLNVEMELIPGSRNPADAMTRAPFATEPDTDLADLAGSVNPLLTRAGWAKLMAYHQAVEEGVEAGVEEGVALSAAPVSADSSGAVGRTDVAAAVAGVRVAAVGVALQQSPFSEAQILEEQAKDARIQEGIAFLQAGRPYTARPVREVDEDPDAFKLRREAWEKQRAGERAMRRYTSGWFITDGGVVVRRRVRRGKPSPFRVVLPESLQAKAMDWAHDGKAAGPHVHAGVHGPAMLANLRGAVWWPDMDKSVSQYQCPVCARQRAVPGKPRGFMHATLASRPGELMSVDSVPMPKVNGYIGFILVADKFSGALYAHPYKGKSANQLALATISALDKAMFIPQTLLADQESGLTSAEFKRLLEARGVEVHHVHTEHQQANFVERGVQSIKGVIRTTLDALPRGAWLAALPTVIRARNASLSAPRGFSPMEILSGVPPPLGFPMVMGEDIADLEKVKLRREDVWELVRKNMEQAALKAEEAYNANRRPSEVEVGDSVLLRTRAGEKSFNLEPRFGP
ncbi:MAG: DDE-type integrase/transposase/recombinase, partial [Planctomycetes bacterium]|nr:DDE-type integrase/transposase/recombinase [Planctomycetota bacterium]